MPIDRSYSLSVVRGLTGQEVSRLKRAGIDSTRELLSAAGSHRAEQNLAKATGLTLDRMREAVNRADLMRVGGLGAARADLFENAGVNSVKELAQRNPAALAKTLERYVKAHPELNYRLPSPSTVASLVAKAKELASPQPTEPLTAQTARAPAAAALHKHIDEVLFSNHPDGAQFRDAVLGWRPSTEWPQVQQRMHDDVEAFMASAELAEDPTRFTFYGGLFGLYTEVSVDKTTRQANRVYVEID